jgi:membrane associated rhomboid family serine protease
MAAPGGKGGGGGGLVSFNAPVTLGLTMASALVVALNQLSGGAVNRVLVGGSASWLDPLLYVRALLRFLAHADASHYFGNFMLILVVGPMAEEKYGSRPLLTMLAITALATMAVNFVFFPRVALIGASGLAFMLILLSSFANFRDGRLPLTVLLVGVFYLGNEVLAGLFRQDNISQAAHIVGGLCGAAFGFHYNKR